MEAELQGESRLIPKRVHTCGGGPTASSVLFVHLLWLSVLTLLLMTCNGLVTMMTKLVYHWLESRRRRTYHVAIDSTPVS